jgi:hypothetical protein
MPTESGLGRKGVSARGERNAFLNPDESAGMARTDTLDYPTITKRGFLLGLGLFAIGVAGDVIGQVLLGGLPAWEETLLVDLAGLGILLCLLVPFVFGILLPLTE